jgi:hypothetical protein
MASPGTVADADLVPLLAHARGFHGGGWQRARLAGLLGPSAAAISDPSCVCVVAGQQPALGGGPLYTLIKAAHAVALAGRLGAAGQPAVAVFWCASEDHDLGEAGHADLVEDDGSCVRITHALGGGRASLRFRSALAGWRELEAALARRWPAGHGAGWLADHAPAAGEGMGAWQCRLLAALFPGRLACIEAATLRPLWPTALARALSAWPAAELERERQGLLARGTADPFGPLPEPPLFDDRADERQRLEPPAAQALAASDPARLSPGAALRPALQQAALPVACFIAGPGEIAYHQVLGPVYAALGVAPPLLIPRLRAALVPPRLAAGCAAWGVDPALLTPTTRPTLPIARHDATAAAGEQVDGAALLELDRQIAWWHERAAGHPGLRGRVRALDHARGILSRGLQRESRRRRALPPFATLLAVLFPRGQPQERVLSLAQALWRHGPGLAERLVACAHDGADPQRPAVIPAE